MWLLEFLFFAMTLVICWLLFGYLLFVWFIGLFRRKGAPVFPTVWPTISVLVPCFNEEDQIIAKLEDLRKLDYPRNSLEVLFTDGGSADRTLELLAAAIHPDEPIRVLKCPTAGKIQQLNHALVQTKGEIIVNTDADARLAPDALKWLAAEFALSADVWVAGAYCRPAQSLPIEDYYWSTQNRGRFLESDAGCCSIVIAQCYAFRRALLTAFPDNVVADDIYVAFLANTMGFRTVYSRHASALETRAPHSYSEFLPHKFRKSNAFLRESLRFIYRLPEMGHLCKLMMLTRTGQQLILPSALLFWVLLAGALLTLFRWDIVGLAAVSMFVCFLITSRIFAHVKLPDNPQPHSLLTMIAGYFLTMLILLATGLSYPFFQQRSSYARINMK
ncbi:MAG: glycosyltransferase [Verrucomicrobia bacterium]|nr:glycosyltransferase [Verrucomicrobiota bacterium]